MTPRRCFAPVLMLALIASACGGPLDPSKNKTESFSGSVQPLSFGPVHTFDVPSLGELTATVQTISPGNTFLGIGYGQPSGGFCSLIQQNAVSSSNLGRTVLTGQIVLKGQYCVVLFDPTNLIGVSPLTVAQNYTVQVSHP